MKYKEALKIMESEPKGYMVHFEKVEGSFLWSDHFPDKHAREELIKTESEAWDLARRFAEKTFGKCVNIYVIDETFSPVYDFRYKEIINR